MTDTFRTSPCIVIPAKAGIQTLGSPQEQVLDASLRKYDGKEIGEVLGYVNA